MGDLQKNIIKEITKQYRKMGFLAASNTKKELPLFLSGGVDSTLCGLVAQSLGLTPVAIVFRRDGVQSKDFDQAIKTCDQLGWKIHTVEVPPQDPKDVFFKLVREYGVNRKKELEVLYPFLFMLDKAKELGFEKIVCGFNPSPDSDKKQRHNREDSDDFWKWVVENNVTSSASKKVVQVYKDEGITVCCPLEGLDFKKALVGLSNADMNKPYNKSFYKDCYPEIFEQLGMMRVRNVPMQKGGSMTEFFAPLVHDPEINFKRYKTDNVTGCLTKLVALHAKSDTRTITKHAKRNQAHRLWIENNLRNYSEGRRQTEYQPYLLKDVLDASSQKLFTVVSTFAGGGGSSTGYRLAGGNVLAINEFVPEAVRTYSENFPDTFVDHGDIRKITRRNGKQGVLDWFGQFGVKENELDILDGSPPCATFSKATGKRVEEKTKHEAKNKQYSEVTQDRVGMLIHDYVYLANCIHPKICIIENVPEISSSTVFHDALKRLRGHGYFVQFKKLKAHHYGVPQRRERLFAIGIRGDICKKIGITDEREVLTLFPKGSSFHPTVQDALSDLELDEQDQREISLIRQEIRRTSSYEIIRAIPKNPPRPSRLHEHHKGFKNFYFNTYRTAWGEPAPTITQSGNQLGGRGGICHPEEDRTFTIRELKRLSSLPDDFKLTGNFNQRAERIGRMVPPRVTEEVAKTLYEQVLARC